MEFEEQRRNTEHSDSNNNDWGDGSLTSTTEWSAAAPQRSRSSPLQAQPPLSPSSRSRMPSRCLSGQNEQRNGVSTTTSCLPVPPVSLLRSVSTPPPPGSLYEELVRFHREQSHLLQHNNTEGGSGAVGLSPQGGAGCSPGGTQRRGGGGLNGLEPCPALWAAQHALNCAFQDSGRCALNDSSGYCGVNGAGGGAGAGNFDDSYEQREDDAIIDSDDCHPHHCDPHQQHDNSYNKHATTTVTNLDYSDDDDDDKDHENNKIVDRDESSTNCQDSWSPTIKNKNNNLEASQGEIFFYRDDETISDNHYPQTQNHRNKQHYQQQQQQPEYLYSPFLVESPAAAEAPYAASEQSRRHHHDLTRSEHEDFILVDDEENDDEDDDDDDDDEDGEEEEYKHIQNENYGETVNNNNNNNDNLQNNQALINDEEHHQEDACQSELQQHQQQTQPLERASTWNGDSHHSSTSNEGAGNNNNSNNNSNNKRGGRRGLLRRHNNIHSDGEDGASSGDDGGKNGPAIHQQQHNGGGGRRNFLKRLGRAGSVRNFLGSNKNDNNNNKHENNNNNNNSSNDDDNNNDDSNNNRTRNQHSTGERLSEHRSMSLRNLMGVRKKPTTTTDDADTTNSPVPPSPSLVDMPTTSPLALQSNPSPAPPPPAVGSNNNNNQAGSAMSSTTTQSTLNDITDDNPNSHYEHIRRQGPSPFSWPVDGSSSEFGVSPSPGRLERSTSAASTTSSRGGSRRRTATPKNPSTSLPAAVAVRDSTKCAIREPVSRSLWLAKSSGTNNNSTQQPNGIITATCVPANPVKNDNTTNNNAPVRTTSSNADSSKPTVPTKKPTSTATAPSLASTVSSPIIRTVVSLMGSPTTSSQAQSWFSSSSKSSAAAAPTTTTLSSTGPSSSAEPDTSSSVDSATHGSDHRPAQAPAAPASSRSSYPKTPDQQKQKKLALSKMQNSFPSFSSNHSASVSPTKSSSADPTVSLLAVAAGGVDNNNKDSVKDHRMNSTSSLSLCYTDSFVGNASQDSITFDSLAHQHQSVSSMNYTASNLHMSQLQMSHLGLLLSPTPNQRQKKRPPRQQQQIPGAFPKLTGTGHDYNDESDDGLEEHQRDERRTRGKPEEYLDGSILGQEDISKESCEEKPETEETKEEITELELIESDSVDSIPLVPKEKTTAEKINDHKGRDQLASSSQHKGKSVGDRATPTTSNLNEYKSPFIEEALGYEKEDSNNSVPASSLRRRQKEVLESADEELARRLQEEWEIQHSDSTKQHQRKHSGTVTSLPSCPDLDSDLELARQLAELDQMEEDRRRAEEEERRRQEEENLIILATMPEANVEEQKRIMEQIQQMQLNTAMSVSSTGSSTDNAASAQVSNRTPSPRLSPAVSPVPTPNILQELSSPPQRRSSYTLHRQLQQNNTLAQQLSRRETNQRQESLRRLQEIERQHSSRTNSLSGSNHFRPNSLNGSSHYRPSSLNVSGHHRPDNLSGSSHHRSLSGSNNHRADNLSGSNHYQPNSLNGSGHYRPNSLSGSNHYRSLNDGSTVTSPQGSNHYRSSMNDSNSVTSPQGSLGHQRQTPAGSDAGNQSSSHFRGGNGLSDYQSDPAVPVPELEKELRIKNAYEHQFGSRKNRQSAPTTAPTTEGSVSSPSFPRIRRFQNQYHQHQRQQQVAAQTQQMQFGSLPMLQRCASDPPSPYNVRTKLPSQQFQQDDWQGNTNGMSDNNTYDWQYGRERAEVPQPYLNGDSDFLGSNSAHGGYRQPDYLGRNSAHAAAYSQPTSLPNDSFVRSVSSDGYQQLHQRETMIRSSRPQTRHALLPEQRSLIIDCQGCLRPLETPANYESVYCPACGAVTPVRGSVPMQPMVGPGAGAGDSYRPRSQSGGYPSGRVPSLSSTQPSDHTSGGASTLSQSHHDGYNSFYGEY